LLREYARALAAADQPIPARAAAERLINFYAHVAAGACRHIATWTTAGGRLPPTEPPASAPQLTTSQEAADWLDARRPNSPPGGGRGNAGALDRERGRDGRLPARPRPLAASDGPIPDGAARSAGGRGPARRGRHA